ncbi:lipopolysaccharide cholinephosphotransferase [Trichococcus ilyis]|uniref:Licd n=2 Tax=Trichococcus ilyis TaxID=640938 RepID=A0A143YU32_9LACT|nr:licd [Trichococcus ilyis]SEJ05503.1 lipopolysaccharide cholinephosphotransferase [Trichococcus ilyis]
MGLKYSLAWGTLIGAVRHNGFIPWDDDIDILMPRRDYIMLLSKLKNLEHPKYKLYSIYNKDCYYYSVSRIVDTTTIILGEKKTIPSQCDCGVFVDIYPLDYMGNSIENAVSFFKTQSRLELLKYMALSPFQKSCSGIIHSIIKSPVFVYTKIRGYRYFEKKAEQRCERNVESKLVGCWVGNGGMKAEKLIFDTKCFEKLVLHKFEEYEFYIPEDYDTVLSNVYGDYMQFPPIEEQVGHHEYEAFRI